MALPAEHLQTILDLEARHDELLELLADLERRVASVLAECQPTKPNAGEAASVQFVAPIPPPQRAAAA
jgi:hypothetical protein